MTAATKRLAPLNDQIVIAVARLVDDAQAKTRAPSHSDLEYQINRAGLRAGDPNQQGNVVGKAKRIRAVLNRALVNDLPRGQEFVAQLIAHLQGCGGFRPPSPNFVGADAIENARAAFRAQGFELTADGDLRAPVLESLAGTQLTEALTLYVVRAQRGAEDAALLTGTGKDLLEATAAHVCVRGVELIQHYVEFSDPPRPGVRCSRLRNHPGQSPRR